MWDKVADRQITAADLERDIALLERQRDAVGDPVYRALLGREIERRREMMEGITCQR
jgi:hypothetical protein